MSPQLTGDGGDVGKFPSLGYNVVMEMLDVRTIHSSNGHVDSSLM